MLTAFDTGALVVAGVIAGAVGSAGGITSLVSYPALLAVGLHARPASIANIIALVACWPGSALASQPELSGWGGWLWRWSLVAASGGAAGAVVLLLTPAGLFEQIVPFLVAGASVALLFEPRLTAWRERHHEGPHLAALAAGVLALSVYNGYFGAGSGVMTLTLMLLLVDRHLPTANALKNMLIGAGTIASAAIFALTGSVDWSAVIPLGVGMLIGSSLGPRVTRRLPARLLRLLIVLLGMGLAVQLWINS
jgi:uncharacterized membrane protein YfcA